MAPFNDPLIDARLEHEARTVIANGCSSSTTERILTLKIADDIGNQDQMLAGDDFLVEGF